MPRELEGTDLLGDSRTTGSLERWLLTSHIQSNPVPRKPAAHYCTELHRATTPNAEKRESPLVIRCKFGAVTNSKALTDAHGHAPRHANM